MSDGPLFTVLTPVYRPPLEYLLACVRSVVEQTCQAWELLLVDDGNDDPDLIETLGRLETSDARIRLVRCAVNGGIAAASQRGLDEARGTFLALLDHDDTLSPVALERMAEVLSRNPSADYAYSDEDKIDLDGIYVDPFFKPDWSPERFRHQMYTCHFSILRTNLVREVGGFRAGYDGSQDYDLVLRVTERARQIIHVAEVLYHWRIHAGSTAASLGQKPAAAEAARRAVQDHCLRLGIDADVLDGPTPGTLRVRRRLPALPRVSLIVPTNGKSANVRGDDLMLVRNLLETVSARTSYDEFEFVLVHDASMSQDLLRETRAATERPTTLVSYAYEAGAFNFSHAMNLGAIHANGEALVLLNDDTEPVNADWLAALIEHVHEPQTGAVGALLRFEDETLQHAGVVCSAGPYHLFYAASQDTVGFGNAVNVVRETLVVTGAVLAVKRNDYLAVGGMSEDLPNNYNDVDLCLKLHASGRRNLWTPFAQLYHFEGKTRGVNAQVQGEEHRVLSKRWGPRLYRDPYYNPNLRGAWPRGEPYEDWDVASRLPPGLVVDLGRSDLQGYLDLNPDLAAALAADPEWDLYEHFLKSGRHEGRLCSPRKPRPAADVNQLVRVQATPDNYDRDGYLRANPDLRSIADTDLTWDVEGHFRRHGVAEGRLLLRERTLSRPIAAPVAPG